jgi:hypothetical protein
MQAYRRPQEIYEPLCFAETKPQIELGLSAARLLDCRRRPTTKFQLCSSSTSVKVDHGIHSPLSFSGSVTEDPAAGVEEVNFPSAKARDAFLSWCECEEGCVIE